MNIELSSGPDITDFLRSLPEVSDVVKSNQAYRIKLPRTEKALPAIVDGVTKKGLEIKEISFTKPTLDEVFLDITGKSMRDEDASESDSVIQNIMNEKMR